MPLSRCFTFVLFVLMTSTQADAGAILDRVKQAGVIRCGAAPRPGLVSVGANGAATGLYLDLCRAVGAAVLGPNNRLEFHLYQSSNAYDAVREGTDDVFFLDGAELVEEELVSKILPGPTVFIQTTGVMVPESFSAQHVADLAGQPICYSSASSTDRNLNAWFAARRLDFTRMPYQEDVELYDAYHAQVCRGLAAELTTLASVRLDGGVNNIRSKILPEPLSAFPIIAATPMQDPVWASIAAWTIHTLIEAESPKAEWASGGIDAMPIAAPELLLVKDWQTRVVGAVGDYGAIFRRNLGEESPYRLPRGLNASWKDGGGLIAPHLE